MRVCTCYLACSDEWFTSDTAISMQAATLSTGEESCIRAAYAGFSNVGIVCNTRSFCVLYCKTRHATMQVHALCSHGIVGVMGLVSEGLRMASAFSMRPAPLFDSSRACTLWGCIHLCLMCDPVVSVLGCRFVSYALMPTLLLSGQFCFCFSKCCS